VEVVLDFVQLDSTLCGLLLSYSRRKQVLLPFETIGKYNACDTYDHMQE
jgi:hypothetical protein